MEIVCHSGAPTRPSISYGHIIVSLRKRNSVISLKDSMLYLTKPGLNPVSFKLTGEYPQLEHDDTCLSLKKKYIFIVYWIYPGLEKEKDLNAYEFYIVCSLSHFTDETNFLGSFFQIYIH